MQISKTVKKHLAKILFLCHIQKNRQNRFESDMQKEYDVKKVVNLPTEEINRIQKQIDAENLETIEKACNEYRISPLERDYLLNFYADGMSVYRDVYRTLYETFRRPERTCSVNLESGKVDCDNSGNPIDYGLKAVTPFTCTRLEYVDKFNNPIYIIFPRMKSADRAIEKLERKYGKEYQTALYNAARLAFEQEDREAFAEKLQSIPQSNERLHDIIRLTITSKYLSGVERITQVLAHNHDSPKAKFYINKDEIRNRFTLPLSKNAKRYYDIKMIVHQKKDDKLLDMELQLKIQALYEADLRTHKIYEEVRTIEASLPNKPTTEDTLDMRQKTARIKILNNRIRQINENSIHQYNMMVLDKARRIEDDGYRPLRIEPDNKDGTYDQCRQFIQKEYLVESYDTFNPETAFSADNEINKLSFLRLLGKLETDFNETDENASKVINYKFSRLTLAEKERFNGINEIAHRYSSIIRRKILAKKKLEPIMQTPALSPKRGREL